MSRILYLRGKLKRACDRAHPLFGAPQKMKRPGWKVVGIVALAVIGGLFWYQSTHLSKAEIASTVKSGLQQKLSSGDLSEFHMSVKDVTVLHETGNKYRAMATVDLEGKPHQVAVSIVADGNQLAWETEQGAFLFAAQEKAQQAIRQFQADMTRAASEADAAAREAQEKINENASAPPMPQDVQELASKWEALNESCRDSATDPDQPGGVCAKREKMYSQITSAGWCWGHKDDFGYQRHWVRCAPGDA
ncbi:MULTISPECIES: hypothetical protein [Burkholderia]|uniref:hypothetical protein n=1 Tax=Burkholderia TaxID=32008 RepID=UPI000DC384DF|nr:MULTISPECIES: hypothetical protein [Burkholderia]MDP9548297.1 hypothetical protein [Burkholderia cepacia]MBR8469413.1 hypothetical protein [Burkholderia cenocepacia]MDP9598529.1 hypothetical protein [Burkholderia cepacia]MDP9626473.1 hypothetical protein [Burkholderia cepacia]MDP9672537.1 hypothetical protein [Burkholderia cepacia]